MKKQIEQLKQQIADLQAFCGVLASVFEKEYKKQGYNWKNAPRPVDTKTAYDRDEETMTPTAQDATRKLNSLRKVTLETGVITNRAQREILKALSPEDLAAQVVFPPEVTK